MATRKEVAGKPRVLTIGQTIDQLHTLREKKRELQAQVDELDAQYRAIEEQLVDRLQKEDTDVGRGKLATASLSVSVDCTLTDFDAFQAWVIKTKNVSILQRRISAPMYRELLEKGVKIPGTEPFNRTRLNLRNL